MFESLVRYYVLFVIYSPLLLQFNLLADLSTDILENMIDDFCDIDLIVQK
jgi:hypothetical protein